MLCSSPDGVHRAQALRPGGVICVKDNCYATEIKRDGTVELFYVDRDDSSVTRSAEYLEAVFRHANMKVVLKETETGFPGEIFPVKMYALASQQEDPLSVPASTAGEGAPGPVG